MREPREQAGGKGGMKIEKPELDEAGKELNTLSLTGFIFTLYHYLLVTRKSLISECLIEFVFFIATVIERELLQFGSCIIMKMSKGPVNGLFTWICVLYFDRILFFNN